MRYGVLSTNVLSAICAYQTYLISMFLKIYTQVLITFLLAVLSNSAMSGESDSGQNRVPAKFYFLDNTALYFGDIDETVNHFISATADKEINRLIINSRGGDVHFGIVFGYWIHENQIDVEVTSLCMSSCANYIFTAARKKVIRPSALVIWHGSAEQKNLREKNEKYEEYLALSLSGKTSREQEEYLASDKLRYENFSRLLSEQRQFFKNINVNEYVTRLGQEPINYKRSWVATVEVMNKMNIQSISAPAGYGSPDYMQTYHPAQIDRLVSFGLNIQEEIKKLD
ncbi:hypothetical protein ACO0LF_19120 [Undibacterium sp. Di27W]|uniref:hypothetical protein n=1 Tax=Undibacterium sp. Di27W TaxID=3413036 RepID=UPI003BF27245